MGNRHGNGKTGARARWGGTRPRKGDGAETTPTAERPVGGGCCTLAALVAGETLADSLARQQPKQQRHGREHTGGYHLPLRKPSKGTKPPLAKSDTHSLPAAHMYQKRKRRHAAESLNTASSAPVLLPAPRRAQAMPTSAATTTTTTTMTTTTMTMGVTFSSSALLSLSETTEGSLSTISVTSSPFVAAVAEPAPLAESAPPSRVTSVRLMRASGSTETDNASTIMVRSDTDFGTDDNANEVGSGDGEQEKDDADDDPRAGDLSDHQGGYRTCLLPHDCGALFVQRPWVPDRAQVMRLLQRGREERDKPRTPSESEHAFVSRRERGVRTVDYATRLCRLHEALDVITDEMQRYALLLLQEDARDHPP